jgi:hypothetical protein
MTKLSTDLKVNNTIYTDAPKNTKNAQIVSVILFCTIILITLIGNYVIFSTDDCTTTKTKYADGRVVSERICE